MTKFYKFLLLYGTISLALPLHSQQRGPATPTTVCDLAEHPERYSAPNDLVRVRAFILSDLRHSTVLADSACNKAGISLESGEFDKRPIQLVKDKNYAKLERLHPRIPELLNKGQKVYGSFDGLFEWHPENAPRGPLRALLLRQVTDLHVGESDDPKYSVQGR